MKKYLPLLFIAVIYFAIMMTSAQITASDVFGWLGFSIAAGSVVYFMIFAPYGLKTHTTVFGKEREYRSPVADIPVRVAARILGSVLLCLLVSFGFYVYAN